LDRRVAKASTEKTAAMIPNTIRAIRMLPSYENWTPRPQVVSFKSGGH
jgi:hypothetical protein